MVTRGEEGGKLIPAYKYVYIYIYITTSMIVSAAPLPRIAG